MMTTYLIVNGIEKLVPYYCEACLPCLPLLRDIFSPPFLGYKTLIKRQNEKMLDAPSLPITN